MATSAGEVEVKLTLKADDFKRMLGESQNSLGHFGNALGDLERQLLTVFSFAAIADFFKHSLDAYAENELAITKLVSALNNQGLATDKNVQHLENLAESLASLTGIDKTAIVNAQALLTTFGIQGETMDRVTQAALDLSAATGVDLQRAALLLGKAYEGQTSSLSRYGIIVNEHIDLQHRFGAVMDQTNQRFGGAAAAQGNTYTGMINKMKVAFHDFQEEVGKFLSGPAGGLVSWITETVRGWGEFMKTVNASGSIWRGLGIIIGTLVLDAFRNLGQIILSVLFGLSTALSTLPLVGSAFKSTAQSVAGMSQELNKGIDLMKLALVTSLSVETQKQEAVLQTKTIVMQSVEVADRFVRDKMEDEAKLRTKLAAETKAAHEDFVRGFITTEGDMWTFASDLRDSFTKGFGDGFAKMVMEGKSFTDSMKSLFRDMATQVISYIVQIIVKLTALWALEEITGTQGLGSAIGGMRTGLSGFMANGGMITEPSVLMGLKSGRAIGVGENGPEMVVPMGKNTTADEMGGMPGKGGGGGGNITINISGQFLEADSSTWNKLMRDQIIPQIRRFTMISSTGPFNRTRGVV